jgi:hypothetical protein
MSAARYDVQYSDGSVVEGITREEVEAEFAAAASSYIDDDSWGRVIDENGLRCHVVMTERLVEAVEDTDNLAWALYRAERAVKVDFAIINALHVLTPAAATNPNDTAEDGPDSGEEMRAVADALPGVLLELARLRRVEEAALALVTAEQLTDGHYYALCDAIREALED